MTIRELYYDESFNNVVYFLSECGFSCLDDLQAFDFNELLFVPGVSEDIIEEAKRLYYNSQNTREQRPNCEAVTEGDTRSLATEATEVTSPPATTEHDDELQDIIAQCVNSLHIVFRSVSSLNQVAAIRYSVSYIETQDDIDVELLTCICDVLEEYLDEKSVNASETVIYSVEEEELLRSVNIEAVFAEAKRGSAMIHYCNENGITNLWDLRDFNFSSKTIKGLGPDTAEACKNVYRLAVKNTVNLVSTEPDNGIDPIEQFLRTCAGLKDNARSYLLLKAQGQTLQEIGNSKGVTRERVRQVISKAVKKLNSASGPILKKLMRGQNSFYKSDIKKLFTDPEHLDCFAYVLENTETVQYFEFAYKFVYAELVPNDWEERLYSLMQELVGDFVNYYDILEEVEIQLAKCKMSFLDASDFMGYLFEKRYIAVGDYIMKRRGAYKRICYDVILQYFKTGIKLDSDEENQDMLHMREIIFKEYEGYTLPDNNRAITARVAPDLILCGRGRYCVPKSVILDADLFAQIVEYINGSGETSLYYSEIFAVFSGRLLAETSVDNANYLHGALKYLYPDDFEYERDLLVKHGMSRVTFGERLANIIKNNGGHITKRELLRQFPGVTDIQIVNAIAMDPKLIQWGYNQFNHIDNVHYTDSDVKQLRIILDKLLDSQDGYSSETNFYKAIKNEYSVFLDENKIESSLNLFYTAAYIFGEEYRFSRPHIASRAFPDMDLTNINIARFFVGNRLELQYPEFVQISQRAGWSDGTLTIILNAIEEDYIKVDLNRYIHRSAFSIDPDAIEATKQQLWSLVSDSGYYGIFAIFNYEGFPSLTYEWNEYLLQSIIENYDMGFRLLEPKVKDRRYKKGIIVFVDNPCQNYEDFVIAQMKADGIFSIAKDAFSGYLRRKGLVLTATIPLELYDGDGLRLEGNNFVSR